MVAASEIHTVGLQSNGKVRAAGYNYFGQCDVESWEDICQVAAGLTHTVGVKSGGKVVAVGNNDFGQCNVESWEDICQVAAGLTYTVGLKSDGRVVAVGNSGNGECDVSSWTDICQVAAGESHTVGLKSDGTVLATGFNAFFQCDVRSWTGICQVAAGADHTVGLKSNGKVVAVGRNDDGRCNVDNWTDIVQVAAGAWHTVGLKSNGTVVAVGHNGHGQCDVSSWTDIKQVAAGVGHTVGMWLDGTDGKVVAVGNKAYGQCDVSGWNLGLVGFAPRSSVLKAPWQGFENITQGNNAPSDPTRWSHFDHGDWENTYAIDIGMSENTPVLAPADGIVAWYDDNDTLPGGNELAIRHRSSNGSTFVTVYLHLNEIVVKSGPVRQGEIVARSGNTYNYPGYSSGPHLHFHIWGGVGTYEASTAPIEDMRLKHVVREDEEGEVGDSDFRRYSSLTGDLDNNIAGHTFESSNLALPIAQNTPAGSNIAVALPGIDIGYEAVSEPGATLVTKSTENPGGVLPAGVRLHGLFSDIQTTATYVGMITTGIHYDATQVHDENMLRLFHWVGTSWEDVTTFVDTANKIVYGQVASLSPFFVGEEMAAWDINLDAKVDYKDLAMLGAAYGTGAGDPGFRADADINQDGVINYKDLAMLGAHYGEV